jgi:excinuclease ABC subunit C
LLNVPGIGTTRRRALLTRFGSLAGVRTASAEELSTVPGISRVIADRILQHLSEQS